MTKLTIMPERTPSTLIRFTREESPNHFTIRGVRYEDDHRYGVFITISATVLHDSVIGRDRVIENAEREIARAIEKRAIADIINRH